MNQAWATKKQGFTIVELLIVVVVIAILAAITLAAYNGIRSRASSSVAASALKEVVKSLEVYKTINEAYPATLTDAGVNSGSTTYQYHRDNAVTPAIYCITTTVDGADYYINSSTNTSATEGVCPGHTSGGAPVITNFARNPGGEANADSWTFYPGAGPGVATIVRSNLDRHTGSSALRMEWSVGATVASGCSWFLTIDGISPNTQYYGSLWVKTSIPQILRARADVRQTDTWQALARGVATNIPANQWTRLTVGPFSSVALSNRVTLCSEMISGSTTLWSAGDVQYMDSALLTQGSTLYNFADGSSPGWTWNGTPHASSSTGLAP